ncbi:hypothetical protein F4604DRAFT_1933781 [Suillus subluteus]|nr:hypothetical protein F4604DRAFT_1933781 [Suillus subluteus]
MVNSSPAPAAAQTITVASIIPDNETVPFTFDQFDNSGLDMAHLDDFLANLPLVPYNPFMAVGPTYGLEDLDFSFMQDSSDSNFMHNSSDSSFMHNSSNSSFMHNSSNSSLRHDSSDSSLTHDSSDSSFRHNSSNSSFMHNSSDSSLTHDSSDSFDYQCSTPVTQGPTDRHLPAFSDYTTMPGNIPLSHSNYLPPTTPLTSTSGINTTDSDRFDHLVTGLEEEGPRRTTRRHVPSTREHVLNSIGSSSARVRPPVSVDKENNKRRKADTTGTGQKSRK